MVQRLHDKSPGTSPVAAAQDGEQTLCEVLLSEQRVRPEELQRARELLSESRFTLGVLLVRLDLISDLDMAQLQQRISGCPMLEQDDIPDSPILIKALSDRFLRDAYVLPIAVRDEHVQVAMADPGDHCTLHAIQLACDKPVQVNIATTTQIGDVLDGWFEDGNSKLANLVEEITGDGQENTHSESAEHLKDMASEAPITRLVSLIINRAIELRASDIHIEPFENELRMRYRIDGVLREMEAPPAQSQAAIISRIKIMAKMNIAEQRLAQDGRIQLRAQGKLVDLRVSTVPTLHGESMVLRVLDKEQIELDFDFLGFTSQLKKDLRNILTLAHGILLVTGPTGSGKTTTLYTALRELNTPDQKILTVEDPIEYQLNGINQIQVKPQIGLGFAEALRSIVRQDPDIIMIGEMRDLETAGIAVQSALTGHLVFSTLHTNDAGSSVTRMLDMGVEDYMLTSTLNGILSQRLVRTLCQECRVAYTPYKEMIDELNLRQLTADDAPVLYRATGCALCNDTGYVGRSVIAELLALSEPIRHLILSHSDGATIQNAALREGMESIQTYGIRKALRGNTTIEEVMRTTQSA